MNVKLKENPFFLDDVQCCWVHETLNSLTLREKVGQLICCVSPGDTNQQSLQRYEALPYGGVTFRPGPAAVIKEHVDFIQRHVKIPLLVSANLESGGSGIVTDGTEYGNQLQVAAANDPKYAEILGDICGAEGSAVGVNYAFAPVVDIHYNWRNPIINTRTYGSDPEKVMRFSSAYMRGIAKHNVAVSIKHFPGDGVDERDQHLLASVNTLSCGQWDASYGNVYRSLIDQGAQTVMVGHILLPAYSRALCPGIQDKDILPASLAPEIINGLLRQKLGFNGVVITDSAVMTGLGCTMPRRDIPAACINAGCDIFLFGRNLEEDFENLLAAVEAGVVSAERLDEAVTRVLALKASLGLNRKTKFTADDCEKIIGCQLHQNKARECADRAITLVKDTQNLLPVTPATHPRIWLHVLGDNPAFRGGISCRERVISKLEAEGFQVTCMEGEALERTFQQPVRELKEQFDLILYVANVITGGNDTVNRIWYAPKACGESPQYVKDVPMVPTYINAYSPDPWVIKATIDKMMGLSEFKGVSTVDAFCGAWDTHL